MSLPLVSIMMPAWNASKYIGMAIESCQQQTYENWELCIVDDGSDDDTYDIAMFESIKDTRIRVHTQLHQGCPVARNTSLAMMTGDIIARQDADDLQDPTRLEKQVRYLLDHDPKDLVSCRMYWLKGETLIPQRALGMIPAAYMTGKAGRPVNASIVAWKYVYDKVGGYKPDQVAGSDGDWNFRAIIADMEWGFIDEPLYIYRRHPEQITKRLSAQQQATHYAARKEYFKLWKKK